MFEIGGSEILVILVIALLVLGPQNLPKVAKMIGKITSQLRRVTDEFKSAIEDEVQALELEDLKKSKTKKKDPGGAKPEDEQKTARSEPAKTGPAVQRVNPDDDVPAAPKSPPPRAVDPYGLGPEGQPDPDWDTAVNGDKPARTQDEKGRERG
jgi:sec-independent protein translocase protein TatB